MGLSYFRGDEEPPWVPTPVLNGTAADLHTGWTFTVSLTKPGETTVTKTTGITGADGHATVAWATGELDITEGSWDVQLTCKRTSDNHQFTIEDNIQIKPRTVTGT